MKNLAFYLALLWSLSTPIQALSDFEVINLDEAYTQGFFGKGVKIGILDSGFVSSHPSLISRSISAPFTNNSFHGTAVASVAVGNYFDPSTHGIAYQAQFYGLLNSDINVYQFFKDKEVKIINNSWGYMIYPVLNFQLGNQGEIEKFPQKLTAQDILEFEAGSLKGLKRLAKEKKTLIVFSTGNSGFTSAAIAATLPAYDESLRSWLAVGAISSSQITRESDNKLHINPQGATNFGDGFKGIELFGLVAPGEDVKVANFQGGYTTSSGTSFSSPMVSGVSALIQEKYPFLNGAQIADILLSTANKDYIAPKLVVKSSAIKQHYYYSVIYIDTQASSKEQLANDLRAVGYTEQSVQIITNNLLQITSLSKEEVFGQGILDAQKAINGIAILDINRLNPENILTHEGKKQGFYTFDTQGYNASFDNDISQRQWNEKYHQKDAINRLLQEEAQNLNAGLIKKGGGTLSLTGTNTYKGDTLIQEGILQIKQNKNQGGKLTQSSVYVYQKGELQGNGEISKSLYNQGVVSSGNGFEFGTLKIGETYTQSNEANLKIHFKKSPTLYALSTANATHSTLTATNYNIQGGSLIYLPYQDFYKNGEKITLSLGTLSTELSKFTKIYVDSSFSQTLQFQVIQDQQTILVGRQNNAYKTSNDSLGLALQSLVEQDLDPQYQNYFALIDSADTQTYQTMIKSIDSPLYLAQTKEILHRQNSLHFHSILNALNPTDFLSITPHLTYIKDLAYNGTNLGVSLRGKNAISSLGSLSYFVDLSSFSLSDSQSDTQSISIFAGLNASFDLKVIDLFIGGGAGIGFNHFNRNPIAEINSIQSQYKNILSEAHIGMGKQIGSKLTFTPLAYLSYQYIHQNAFDENHTAFAKSYESYNYRNLSALLGAEMNYLFNLLDLSDITLGLFGNYERSLLNNKLKNTASFLDNPNKKFIQSYIIYKDYFNLGINLQWSKKTFLLKITPSIELAKDFFAPQISLSLGGKF